MSAYVLARGTGAALQTIYELDDGQLVSLPQNELSYIMFSPEHGTIFLRYYLCHIRISGSNLDALFGHLSKGSVTRLKHSPDNADHEKSEWISTVSFEALG